MNTDCSLTVLGKAFPSWQKFPEKLEFPKKNDEEHFIDISTIRQCNKHYTAVHVGKYYSLLKS